MTVADAWRPLVVVLLLVTGATLLVGAAVAVGPAYDTVATDDTLESAPIDEALLDADGEVEAVIVYESPAPDAIAESDRPAATLQASVAETVSPLSAWAAADPAIEVQDTSWLAHTATVTVDTDERSLETLAAIPGVVAIEEPLVFETLGGDAEVSNASTTDADTTYGLDHLNVPEAWDEFDTQGEGTSVAVLDTGVDPDHPDIDVDAWADFTEDPSDDPLDYETHGTHVAGTVVGGDASGQHIGVAPEAELYAGAVLDEDGSGTHDMITGGMEWAVDEEVDLISMSLGAQDFSSDTAAAYIQAVSNAHATGTAVVAASGNEGIHTARLPGNLHSVISVGASTENRNIWFWSSSKEIDTEDEFGGVAPQEWPSQYIVPDITAPGHQVYSAISGGGYEYFSGTSMATPHASGVAALLQSATDQELGHEDYMTLLTETADHPDGVDEDLDFGHGIVDAYAALEAATTIDGTVSVTDSVTDEPLDDATVTLTDTEGTTHTATTGLDGVAHLEGLSGLETYEATVERDGYHAYVSDPIEATTDDDIEADAALDGDAAIEVTLEDGIFGGPIEGATLETEGPFGAYPTTDAAEGTYTIEDVPSVGEYTVTVEASGYLTEVVTPTVDVADETVSEQLSMDGDATLAIDVVDADDGEALENASVLVQTLDGVNHTDDFTTDADGTVDATVPGVDEAYNLTVSLEDYHTTETTTDPVGPGETAQVTIELEAVSEFPWLYVGAGVAAIALAAGYALYRRRQ